MVKGVSARPLSYQRGRRATILDDREDRGGRSWVSGEKCLSRRGALRELCSYTHAHSEMKRDDQQKRAWELKRERWKNWMEFVTIGTMVRTYTWASNADETWSLELFGRIRSSNSAESEEVKSWLEWKRKTSAHRLEVERWAVSIFVEQLKRKQRQQR